MTSLNVFNEVNDLPLADAALAYAEAGFKVLPVVPGDKNPLIPGGFNNASSDPDQVRAWWNDYPEANIGLPMESNGLVAIDIDDYKDNEMEAWKAFMGGKSLPDTLVQTSARGGTHHIYRHEQGASYPGFPGDLTSSDHVDVRHRAYVLVAPSRFVDKDGDGGSYQFTAVREIADAPDWLKRSAANDNWSPSVSADEGHPNPLARALSREAFNAQTVARLLFLLNTRQNTIEDRSDWLNVVLGCHHLVHGTADERRVFEAAKAWSLRWNLGPFARPGELEKNFVSTWRSANADHKGPVTSATTVAILEREPPRPIERSSIAIEPHRFLELSRHDPTPWLLGQHYVRRSVSLTSAPGGTGKSSLALVECLSLASGKGLLGQAVYGPRRVLYVNGGEDGLAMVRKRVDVAMHHYGLSDSDLGNRLLITTVSEWLQQLGRPESLSLHFVKDNGRGRFETDQYVCWEMAQALQALEIDVVVFDPLSSFHAVNENDNAAMNALATSFDTITKDANCAVELVHHSTKEARTGSGGIATARGASSLVDKVRSARTLAPLSADDRKAYKIEDETTVVRVSGGKSNYSQVGGSTVLQLVSVKLDNGNAEYPKGDKCGVVDRFDLPNIDEADPMLQYTIAMAGPRVLSQLDGQTYPWSSQSSGWIGFTLAAELGLEVGEGRNKAQRSVFEENNRAAIVDWLNAMVKSGALERSHEKKANNDKRQIVIVRASNAPPTDLSMTGPSAP